MKALVDAFNQKKALVGAFYVIVQPVAEPMDSFTALVYMQHVVATFITGQGWQQWALDTARHGGCRQALA